MKILYIAGKSNDAELIAFTLRSVAPGLIVAWAASTEQARRWIEQNRQVAALIVQVEPDGPDYASFINEIAALGVKPPVIVVAGGSAPPAPAALQALAQTTLPKTASLLNDLEPVVKRVLEIARPGAVQNVTPGPAPAKPVAAAPANPFAQLEGQAGPQPERLNQALAAAARAEAALADSEQRLAEAKQSLERAESRHAAESHDAAARVAELRAHATERSSQGNAAIDVLRAQLVQQATALQRAEQQAAIDRQAAAEEAARRQAKAESELLRETANREALEQKIASAEAARAAAAERHSSELAAITERIGELERESARQLAEAARQREALVAELADADRNLQQMGERHAFELASATRQLTSVRQTAVESAAKQQTTFDAEIAAARDELSRQTGALRSQLAAGEANLQQTKDRHAAELAAAAARLSAAQQQAEAQLTDSEAKLRQTQERHTAEIAGAAARLEETRQESETALAALRAQLADVTVALERAGEQASIDRQTAIDATASLKAAFDADLAQATEKHETVARQLADAEAKHQRAEKHAETELAQSIAQAAEHASRYEARLGEEVSNREAIERELAQAREESARAQQQFLDGVTEIRERSNEHTRKLEERAAGERAEWEATLADRQTRIGQLQRDVEGTRQSLSAREEEIKRVQAAHDTQRANVERARAELAKLRQESAALQEKLDDHVRRFDAAPVSLCRCSADGTITSASRALTRLLGYTTVEDLQRVDFAGAVFASGDELKWLIDRCRSSRTAQSIETTWAKKDGSRIIVRLVAIAAADGGIDLAAEDVTTVKALEEKLNHAQRLESVARLASEVAVTCENLLSGVKSGVEAWLSKIDNNALHYEGERLVADMGRASGFLRQLTLFADKQKQAAPLVAVNNVLQDLASVLKRVAGDNIAFVLPKDSKPLNLDVDAEQVERIFVNVAAYARQRMPLGGRLLIEIAPAVVDREFAEKYPNVRPGAHVLFTVTEQRSPSPSTADAPAPTGARPQNGPGLDLGVLQSLVADSGGHLWIAADPSGDMVLKIHLPRRALDDHEAAKSRGGWISKLAAVGKR